MEAEEYRANSGEGESEKLAISLRMAIHIANQCKTNYRITGSILLAACVNKMYRRIGDVDVIIEEISPEVIRQRLQEEGFQVVIKPFLKWITDCQITQAVKEEYLPLQFFLIGKFEKDYYSRRFLWLFEQRIPAELVRPIQYNFRDIQFTGTPLSFMIEGMKQSRFKPKRKKDFQVIDEISSNQKRGSKQKISLYLLGLRIPLLFEIYKFLYNLIGSLLMKLGNKY